jgi:hypothetical protein
LYNNEDKKDKGDKKARNVKFRLIGLLDKIHNIVIYIQGLTAQIAEFVKLAKKQISLDNRTR